MEVGGIGYRIQATPDAIGNTRAGEEIFIHTHHHQREDAQVLYGFPSVDHRRVFETLIGTHGVGPSLGLAIMAVHDPNQLAEAVATDDVGALCLVPGVGKKTATRLLIELKSRLDVGEIDLASLSTDGEPALSSALQDVREALTGLGYGADEITTVLPKLNREDDSGDMIRQALQILAAA